MILIKSAYNLESYSNFSIHDIILFLSFLVNLEAML